MVAFVWFISSFTLLQQGDDQFVRQEYRTSIAFYEEHLKQFPNDAGALWRIARAYVSLGDISKRDEREALYRKADEYSGKAVTADSLSSDAHTWRAVTVGYIAMYEGSRSKVILSKTIQRELDLAIRLNPNNDVAYSIYGTFYRALGNISWLERSLANLLLGGLPEGGFPEAERSLKKAIELAPTIIRHRYELGMVYLDMKRPADAKKIFTEALQLPTVLASDKNRIERMKRRLSEL